MPNWVNNYLHIAGDPAKIYKLLEGMIVPSENVETGEPTKAFSLAVYHSMPSDIEKPQDWSMINWGTKWEPTVTDYDPLIEFMDDYKAGKARDFVSLHMQSANSAPDSLISYIAEQFPDMEFTLFYYEPGNAFMGEMNFSDGEMQGEWEDDLDYQVLYEKGIIDEDVYEEIIAEQKEAESEFA